MIIFPKENIIHRETSNILLHWWSSSGFDSYLWRERYFDVLCVLGSYTNQI